MVDPPNQKDAEEAMRVIKEKATEIQTAAYGYAQTYTTVVIFGCYAGLFAIWTLTKDHMDIGSAFWAALLIGASLTVFVLFEVFGMIIRSVDFLEARSLLAQELPARQFLEAQKRFSQRAARRLQRVVIPIWVGAVFFTILFGLAGAGVLAVAFLRFLGASK